MFGRPPQTCTDLYQQLEVVPLQIVEFSCEDEAGAGAELPVGLVDYVPEYQLLKVYIRLDKQVMYIKLHCTVLYCTCKLFM